MQENQDTNKSKSKSKSKTAGRGRQKGTGTIFKKGNRFYLQTKTDGVRKTELLYNEDGKPCTTEIQAQEAAKRINDKRRKLDELQDHETAVLEISKTRKLIAGLTTSPADIWGAFEKSATRKQDGVMTAERKAEMARVCGLFVQWCSQNSIITLADITQDTISAFLNAIAKGKSGRTYNAYRSVVKYIFKHTWQQLKLESNPAENIEARTVITEGHRELTPEQVKKLFDGFTNGFYYKNEKKRLIAYNPKDLQQIKVALLFAMFTGARAIDACCMKWSGIDLKSNTLTFRPSKTSQTSGKIVSVPIAAPLLNGILEAQEWREQNRDGEDYITPSVAVRYLENPSTISKVVQKLIEYSTGLKPTAEQEEGRERAAAAFGFHSLRHSFVSFAANAGIPQAVIAEIVGHGSPAMTRHYSHISNDAKAKAIAALPEIEQAEEPKDITADTLRMKCKEIIDTLSIEELEEIINKYK